jgi:hypothetical protein
MKHGTKLEPAWKDKAPGLERAACVMKPRDLDAPLIYALFVKRTSTKAAPGLLGWAEAMASVRYNDSGRKVRLLPDVRGLITRVISAKRVERAVEDAEFMAICDDEGLEVVRAGGTYRVRKPKAPRSWWGPEAQSLRGAYVAYHLECQARGTRKRQPVLPSTAQSEESAA